MKRKHMLGATGILMLMTLISGILFRVSKMRSFQFFGNIRNRINTEKKMIALTFDDAPTGYSDEVVKILEDKGIKATFYVIGKAAEENPEGLKNIVEAGMEVGNHSYSHQRFLLKSYKFVKEEIERTNQLIRQSGYTKETTFRPPYGKKLFMLPWYLKQQGIKSYMCDVEAETYAGKINQGEEYTEYLINYTVTNTRPGSIILLHPFCQSCDEVRKAVPRIIDQLREQGYEFVTVSELAKEEGK